MKPATSFALTRVSGRTRADGWIPLETAPSDLFAEGPITAARQEIRHEFSGEGEALHWRAVNGSDHDLSH